MYLDAQIDRVEGQAEAEFDAMVEAVRIGYIFARDRKAHSKWTRQRQGSRATRSRPMSETALEAAIKRVAQMYPGNVKRVVQ